MQWNWQLPDWPHFKWKADELVQLESRFLHESGIVAGILKHLRGDEKPEIIVEIVSTEAVETSGIEGEILNRVSVQSSLRRNFGLGTDMRKVPSAEQGIADMMTDLYRNYEVPLTHEQLFAWHKMLMRGQVDVNDIGCYRTHTEPMQVISGVMGKPDIHFEAPPSHRMIPEMSAFIDWFNAGLGGDTNPLLALTRAGLAHLYFVSIHPFEDGNGRIGRAIAEKALAQSLGRPTLIALSRAIHIGRKQYYDMLARYNRRMEVTDWLVYFAQTVLDAQDYALRMVEFQIARTRFYDRLRGQLNPRQDKVLARMFREGVSGFKGGLSAKNYIALTGASPATATRDLADLVRKQALHRSGTRRYTRYRLNLDGMPD